MKKQTATFLAFAASLLIAASHPCQAQTPPVPAAYWTMDEISDGTLLDQAGLHNAKVPDLAGQKNKKTGEILPNFTPSTEPGIMGNAVAFEQEQQGFLSVAAPKQFDFASGLTVSAWVKIQNAHSQMILLSCAEDSPNPKGGWCLTCSYGNVIFKAVDSTGKLVTVTSPKDSVAASAWIHIAVIADATTLRIYLNGVESASKPFAGPVTMANTALVIGNHATIAGWRHSECPAFGGLMDEAKIFEKPLTATEIKAESEQSLAGQ